MNRKHKMLWTTALFIGLFSCLPVVMGIFPVDFGVAAGDYDYVIWAPSGIANYKIALNSNGTIDLFVTSTLTDKDSYMVAGVVPSTPTVVANMSKASGTLCVTFSNPDAIYYIILGNKNGASTYGGTYELDTGTCGIPGFEILFVLCALLATFGFLWSKKRLTI